MFILNRKVDISDLLIDLSHSEPALSYSHSNQAQENKGSERLNYVVHEQEDGKTKMFLERREKLWKWIASRGRYCVDGFLPSATGNRAIDSRN